MRRNMGESRFVWDDDKADANFEKHGVTFDEAMEVFEDPNRANEKDEREDHGEERWKTIEVVSKPLLRVCSRPSAVSGWVSYLVCLQSLTPEPATAGRSLCLRQVAKPAGFATGSIGTTRDGNKTLVVVYSQRPENGEGTTRIISAWSVGDRGRRRYGYRGAKTE